MIRTSGLIITICTLPALVFPQTAFAQARGSQEISVIAPQVSVYLEKKRDSGAQRVKVYTVSRRVSFADLDLRTDADAETLRQRIRDSAQEGCDFISKKYPYVRDESCLRTAIDNAMVQAEQVIARVRE